MSKHKRKNRQRDVIPIEEYQKQKELDYTKQQIFNFDTNVLEDEKE